MSQTYLRQRKLTGRAAPSRTASTTPGQAVPNSALLSMMDSAPRELPRVQQRVQAQIPAAEAEADRLSASVTSGSPESVKSAMGRRLGADFSGVRFHTGAAAAAMADAVDARAYTSGADIYFGEGGFDPSVAAHELVHTAQQGIIASSVPTMSTPAGGVQRSGTLAQKFRKHKRHKQDELEMVHRIKTGTVKGMTPEEQAQWLQNHASAAKKYANPRKAAKAKRLAEQRDREIESARRFLADDMGEFFSSQSSFISDPQDGEGDGLPQYLPVSVTPLGMAQSPTAREQAEGALEQSVSMTERAMVAPDMASTLQDANMLPSTGDSQLTGALGFAGMFTNAYATKNSFQDFRNAVREKDKSGALRSGFELLGNGAATVGSAASVGKSFGLPVSEVIPGAGLVTGVATSGKGAVRIHQGRKQVNNLNDFMEQHYGVNLSSSRKDKDARAEKRRQLTDFNDRVMWDSAVQAKMKGTQTKIEGAGDVVTGALDAAGSIAELSGAGGAAGVALKAGSLASKAGFSVASHAQERDIKKKVMAQTTGITDEVIQAFAARNGIEDLTRAKQALLKAMDYQSGKRGELMADQTEKRSRFIVSQAQGPNGSEKAKNFMQSMGVDPSDPQAAEKLALRMGQTRQRSDYARR